MSPFPGGVKSAGVIPPGVIDRWESEVPGWIAAGWRRWGAFATADGFVRAVNPATLVPWVPPPEDLPEAFPLFTTAWGDMVVLRDGKVRLVSYRLGLHLPFPAEPDELPEALADPDIQRKSMQRGSYDEVVAARGEPDAGQCLGHILPLARGGAPSVANTGLRWLWRHLPFLARFHGVPRRLTTGFPPESAALVAKGRYLLETARPGRAYGCAELPDGVHLWQEPGGHRIMVGTDGSVLLTASPSGDALAAWNAGHRTPSDEIARATRRPSGAPAGSHPGSLSAAATLHRLASYTGLTVFPPADGDLGSLGDIESRILVRRAADAYEVWESERGRETLRASASHLADLLRHLALDALAPGTAPRPSGHDIGARLLFLDHGEATEARWTEDGEAHRLSVFRASDALDYFARCVHARLDLKAIARSLAAPDGEPLFGLNPPAPRSGPRGSSRSAR